MRRAVYGTQASPDGLSTIVWLRVPYSKANLEAVKSIRLNGVKPRWSKFARAWWWQVSPSDAGDIIDAIRATWPAEYSSEQLEIEPPPTAEPLRVQPATYSWRRKPYEHQRIAVAAILQRPDFLLLDEMGLGKTQTAIDAACVLLEEERIERVVILTPLSAAPVWAREIRTVAWVNPTDIALVRNNPPAKHPDHIRGLSNREYRSLQLRKRATWTICHYDVVPRHRGELGALCNGALLICDEAHKLRNPRGVISKIVLREFKPSRLLLMTGTPIADKPDDIWALASRVAPSEFGNWYTFMQRYVVFAKTRDGRKFPVGYRNLDDLHRRLQTISLRRRKAECLDLPPKIYEVQYAEWGKQQQQAYTRVQEGLRVLMQDGSKVVSVQAPEVRAQLLRLQQIADGYLSDAPGREVWFEDVPKWSLCMELVREIAQGEKVVLWSRFRPPVIRAAEELADLGAEAIYGDVKRDKRDEIVAAFNADDDRRVLVCQVHTASLGMNLQVASTAIFYDLWWAPGQVAQAEDRIHRIGSNKVVILRLALRNSIDEHVQQMLQRKGEWADAVLGEQQWTRAFARDFLQRLLEPPT